MKRFIYMLFVIAALCLNVYTLYGTLLIYVFSCCTLKEGEVVDWHTDCVFFFAIIHILVISVLLLRGLRRLIFPKKSVPSS